MTILARAWCRLVGHAEPTTLWYEPWRAYSSGPQTRSVVSVCPRCWCVVGQWTETQEEGT